MTNQIIKSGAGIRINKKDGVIDIIIELEEGFDLKNVRIFANIGGYQVYNVDSKLDSKKIEEILALARYRGNEHGGVGNAKVKK